MSLAEVDILVSFFVTNTLLAMVPITLASVGEVFGERAGVVNIGLEGIMLMAALVGFRVAELSANPWYGLGAGVLLGLVLGGLHGIVSIYLQGDQIISGVGINVLGLGVVAFGIPSIWGLYGTSPDLNLTARVPDVPTPVGALSPTVILTILLVLFTAYLLHRTTVGLRVRAVGENPEAADSVGVKVERIRLLATLYGAALAGLAGAFMSIDWTSSVTKDLIAGRGFIALATVVFARWQPLLTLPGGLLFGFFTAFSSWIGSAPGYKEVLSIYLPNMIPYLATLIVVSGVIGRARAPRAIGIPYRRE